MRVAQNELKKIADDLWVVDSEFALPRGQLPFAVPGCLGKCSIRMTVVKLASGKLFIHSPIRPVESLIAAVKNLGAVEWIVGPNVKHNSFLILWADIFPEAKLRIAPKTEKRVPALSIYSQLDDQQPLASDDLKQKMLKGHRSYETIFFHSKTRSLIVTDTIYNIHQDSDFLERLWYIVYGAYGRPGVLRYHAKLISDKSEFRKSLDEVLNWDFDRIIMSHGHIIDRDAKNTFANAWAAF